jgi:hypothetical protein
MNNSITPHTPTTRAQSAPVGLAGDRFVAELERLGLRYLSRGPLPEANAPLVPEARLQVELVPLFLWRPDYAAAALNAADQLAGHARAERFCTQVAFIRNLRIIVL